MSLPVESNDDRYNGDDISSKKGKYSVLQGATEKWEAGTFLESGAWSIGQTFTNFFEKHFVLRAPSTLKGTLPRSNTDVRLVPEGRNEVQVPLAAQNTCHDTCKRDRNATSCGRARRIGNTRGKMESSFLSRSAHDLK